MTDSQLRLAFTLLVVYQFKHFIADFPLQREYMLRKVSPHWDFVLPLSLHSGVHAVLTLAIVLTVQPSLWWLAIFDFAVHFTMDRIKSGPRYLGRFNDRSKPGFWNSLGFDQMVHHLTHYWIIWSLVTY
jgi:hypothetical protein